MGIKYERHRDMTIQDFILDNEEVLKDLYSQHDQNSEDLYYGWSHGYSKEIMCMLYSEFLDENDL